MAIQIRHGQRVRFAFTLIELLVALVLALLMMSALGYSFGFLSRQMQSGRAEVELSGRASSLSVRLRDELRRVTVPTKPPVSQQESAGYFMYYEGPMCDASTALYGQQPREDNEQSFGDSRWGDCDDYLAFTAKAPPGSWFTGKVPRFVVDPTVVDITTTPFNEIYQPVEITSQYAEIVYWVAPEWDHDPYQNYLLGPRPADTYDNGVPLFADAEASDTTAPGHRLPDRYTLRRRVLLIRPDLNFQNGHLPAPSGNTTDFWFQRQFRSGSTPAVRYEYVGNANTSGFDHNWLLGMRLAYQLCDLSVSRVVSAGPQPLITPAPSINVTGVNDVTGVRANSLSDLSAPHNRFAHVRIPGEYFGFATNEATTMPVIALAGSEAFLQLGSRPNNGFPKTVFSASTSNPSRSLFNGYVLPHFQLGDYASSPSLLNDTTWDRTGEDVIASNVLGFDIQGFDPLAPVLVTPGENGVGEQGASATDDLVVNPDDPAFWSTLIHGREAPLASATARYPTNAANIQAKFTNAAVNAPIIANRGAFVDLAYALQAGGTCQDLWSEITKVRSASSDPYVPHGSITATNHLQSSLSGFVERPNTATQATKANTMVGTLQRSGRVLLSSGTLPSVLLFQPVYDTFTDAYESDGFNQIRNPLNFGANSVSYLGTFWLRFDATKSNEADEAVNGLDDPLSGGGVDDDSERETLPPFTHNLRAIRVRIRLEDEATHQMKQLTVIHDFAK